MRRTLLPLLIVSALAAAPAGAAAATYTNPHSLKTEDFGASDAGPMVPFPSVIDVNGTGGNVISAKVTIHGVGHQMMAELDIVLVGPGGQSAVLMHSACPGQNTIAAPLTFVFDDAAPGPLPQTPACVSGTFKPSNTGPGPFFFGPAAPPPPYGTSLAVFNGAPADGLWQLYAYDTALFADGSITAGWTLDLATTSPPAAAKTKPKKCKKAKKRRALKTKSCKRPKK